MHTLDELRGSDEGLLRRLVADYRGGGDETADIRTPGFAATAEGGALGGGKPPRGQELVSLRRHELGNGHPDTLAAIATLGQQRARAGQYAEAHALFSEAIAGYSRLEDERRSTSLEEDGSDAATDEYGKALRQCQRRLTAAESTAKKKAQKSGNAQLFFLFLMCGPGLCAAAMMGWELLGQSAFGAQLYAQCLTLGLCVSHTEQLTQIYVAAMAPGACQQLSASDSAGEGEWRACFVKEGEGKMVIDCSQWWLIAVHVG